MDVYKIGVAIALTDGVSPVLALISKNLLGIKSKVSDIEKDFSRWALAIGGAAGFLAGGAILKGLSSISDKGKELLHQQELMRQAGMANAEIAQATAKAWETSRNIQTTTASENLKHLRELRYATGSTEGAESILDVVTRANAILNAVKGGGQDEVFQLVKALEQKDLATPEKRKEFLSYVDMMTKVVQSTGGRVTPAAFQNTFKYGRTAMLGWNEEFITQIMPRLMQSWTSGNGSGGGAGGPGNALMTAFAKLVQGQLSKTSAEELGGLGLLEYNHRIEGSSKNQVRVKGANLAMTNPYEWVQQVLMPALKDKGVAMDREHVLPIIESISKAMGVRTAAAVLSEFALQGRYFEGDASPFEKDRKLTLGAAGLGGWNTLKANDPDTIDKMYSQQKNAMWEALGSAIAPMKMEIIKGLTSLFTTIAQFSADHATAIKVIAGALASLAVGAVVAGFVAIGAAIAALAGTVGLVAAGVTALATAIGALAAINWSSITGGLSSIASAIASFVSKLLGLIPGGAGGNLKASPYTGMPQMPHGPLGPAPSGKQGYYSPTGLHYGMNDNHTNIYLDGEKVGAAVTRRQVASAQFPNAIGGVDTYGSWTSPGTGLIDAA